MEDTLLEILGAFEVPVIRQGSLAPEAPYPETFFIFWYRSEEEQTAYDNEDVAFVVHEFDVNVYSTNPATVYSLLKNARDALKKAGWETLDRGHDIASDEITHTGRGLTCVYLETITE